jgi:hypothetical protein
MSGHFFKEKKKKKKKKPVTCNLKIFDFKKKNHLLGRKKVKFGTKGCHAQFEYDPSPTGLTQITCPLCHNVTAFQGIFKH